MAKKVPIVDAARPEIEEAWEQWPDRQDPATTQNMFDFFMWMSHERRDLLDYRTTIGDEQWQEVKLWLLKYEDYKLRDT